ncbi:hypothetical protein [Pseudomonas aeruginosa]|uniref:hypothetical protein n=1 Tax=Pseudomonas aeruginosa TaxID=287 RepID=UPI00292A800D|nr:hypothetical protein [Pseudomonas aeruginosa]HEC0594853.1 hypothetical protein [Pseudomonas aeruginosa]HEC1330042.1 hypothetical protein [Pseudomonas aeruginosa]HEC1338913.1 hypothetical protein [Pseudomonas aeruginosa]HEC1370974.1 hypothetical protein [Pseudomonas aeruginosa]
MRKSDNREWKARVRISVKYLLGCALFILVLSAVFLTLQEMLLVSASMFAGLTLIYSVSMPSAIKQFALVASGVLLAFGVVLFKIHG